MGSYGKSEYRIELKDGDVYEEDADSGESYDEYGEEDGEYYDDEYYDDEADGAYDETPQTYDGEYDRVLPSEDKMSRVLSELAELRRSVGIVQNGAAPATVVSYSPVPYTPSYAPGMGGAVVITPPSPTSSTNEITLYNELTRLREEISKVNSSHEMHVELVRLKEEMEREARQKEAQLQEEIRRLNERISELSNKK